MAWPPTIPPNTRTNATITIDNHPGDHNQTADALTETVTEVNLKAPKAGPVFTGQASFAAGSAAAPSITFTGDLNTGVFQSAADAVGVSAGGTERFTISTSAVTSTLPLIHPVGAAATPSVTFTGDLNTGMYQLAADQIGFATGGTHRMGIGATGIIGQVYTADLATSTNAAGYDNTGAHATAVGFLAGAAVTNEGPDNSFFGYQAGYQADYLQLATLVGMSAGAQADMGSAVSSLTAFGYQAGQAFTGTDGVFVGLQAGRSMVTPGAGITAVGVQAGNSATNHTNSTLVGYAAGLSSALPSTGSVTAVGFRAGYLSSGLTLTAIGEWAGRQNSGDNGVFVGYRAGYLNTYASVIILGHTGVATGANQFVVGSAGVQQTKWIPGHDPDTYWDIATSDTVKHYAGGVKVLEINETGSAPFMGFFGTAAVAKPTGVAVSAAGIHAALVTLGLIAP